MLNIYKTQFCKVPLRGTTSIEKRTLRISRKRGGCHQMMPLIERSTFERFTPKGYEVSTFKKLLDDSNRAAADREAVSRYLAWEELLPSSIESPILYVARCVLRLILRKFRKHDYLYLGHGASIAQYSDDGPVYTRFDRGSKVCGLFWDEHDIDLFSEFYTCPEIISSNLRISPSARTSILTTVPKNVDVSRCINIEGVLSKALQHVIGCNLREQFKLFGLRYGVATDLDCCHETNAFNAFISSRAGFLATVDFTNASDSISIALVEALFSNNGKACSTFYRYMSAVRSDTVIVDDRAIVTKKFASMGNAFIFELESIIFYALSVAYCICFYYPRILEFGEAHLDRKVKQILRQDTRIRFISVFGDDVVLPSEAYGHLYIETMASCGLKVNPEKSFSGIDDSFRESCGYDFKDGVFVRSFYAKDLTILTFVRMLNFYQLNGLLTLTEQDLCEISRIVPRLFWCSQAHLRRYNGSRIFYKAVPDSYLIVEPDGYYPKLLMEKRQIISRRRRVDLQATATCYMYARMQSPITERPITDLYVRRVEKYEEFFLALPPDPVERSASEYLDHLM